MAKLETDFEWSKVLCGQYKKRQSANRLKRSISEGYAQLMVLAF
jgi:hypothetical protein|tara:strand:+ start:790 stop:921 length:132 start_codon:yes stop_codon:yes gene_type:complete